MGSLRETLILTPNRKCTKTRQEERLADRFHEPIRQKVVTGIFSFVKFTISISNHRHSTKTSDFGLSPYPPDKGTLAIPITNTQGYSSHRQGNCILAQYPRKKALHHLRTSGTACPMRSPGAAGAPLAPPGPLPPSRRLPIY
eukprot:1188251-Prorocentrum_minimum.AAC.4